MEESMEHTHTHTHHTVVLWMIHCRRWDYAEVEAEEAEADEEVRRAEVASVVASEERS